MNIRLFKPSVGKEELSKIKEAIDRAWIGGGPFVTEFEDKWSEHVGCKMSVALNSCTAALHLSLLCQNFEKGKKVLVPSMTFASTATAVLYCDLVPVFVDSDPLTLGMSLDDLNKKYDEDCVAVIPVHYGGHPVPMEKLVPWARERNLLVVEDCAHTSGSLYKGKSLGSWGDIGCYSFEEKKVMATGDGGMICTSNPEILEQVRPFRWVGMDKDNWKKAAEYSGVDHDAMHWFYEISVLGYKYNMNDLAAAIGLAQLDKLEDMNNRRADIMKIYMDGVAGIEGIEPLLPFEPDKYVYWMFGIRTERRDELVLHLKSKGIATGCHYTPMTMQPLFKPFKNQCNIAEKEYERLITLPFHADLTEVEVRYILENLSNF